MTGSTFNSELTIFGRSSRLQQTERFRFNLVVLSKVRRLTRALGERMHGSQCLLVVVVAAVLVLGCCEFVERGRERSREINILATNNLNYFVYL